MQRWTARPSCSPPPTFAVIAGLQTDVAGVVAAYRLAERIRGCVDHLAADAALRDQSVLQDGGLMAASPGTARTRAHVLLVVGDWPFAAWPEGRNFLLADALSRRQVILLSQAPIELPATADVSWIEAEPASSKGPRRPTGRSSPGRPRGRRFAPCAVRALGSSARAITAPA